MSVKYLVNSNCFLDENDLSFYLLGVYMTDGNVYNKPHNKSFTLDVKDKDWVEDIRNHLSPSRPIHLKKNSMYRLKISDNDSMNWLMSYGCVPCKTYTLKIEKEIPEEFRKDFLRGLIDGDGSITSCIYAKHRNDKTYYYNKLSIYICSASKIFLEQVREYIPKEINSCLFTTKQKDSIIRNRVVTSTCDLYRLSFNDSNAKKLADWIYHPNKKIYLKRKYEVYLNYNGWGGTI